eukprot:2776454-Rhodomonas_salina.2
MVCHCLHYSVTAFIYGVTASIYGDAASVFGGRCFRQEQQALWNETLGMLDDAAPRSQTQLRAGVGVGGGRVQKEAAGVQAGAQAASAGASTS